MNKLAVVWVRFVLFLFLILGLTVTLVTKYTYAQTTDQWTTSLHDASRDGASTDTNITTTTAPQLTKLWSLQTGGPIASQAAIVNGVAYIGSWDGYEYAINDTTGQVLWKTNLGTTFGGGDCNPQGAGVSSAATVQNGVVYVGGGDQYFYALNASTGAVEWKVLTGNSAGTYDGHYNWSSPLLLNGYAYIGVASLGDCPLIPGQLMQVNASNGQVVNTLNLVPSGQVGGGIWTSPSYDPDTNTIYAVTGTEQNDQQMYAQAIIAINASTLAVTSYWHLPETEAVADSDWTTSPMLFTDANGRQLVMATNKNGYTYAFLRSNIAAGPVWSHQIAVGNDCAACGYSTVSSAAIGNGLIYQAGGLTTINGQGYGGSVQALNPATGATVWTHPLTGPVIGAITYDNGMVIDGGGGAFEVLNASNGQRLYSYDTSGGNWFYAAPAISAGVIVTGNTGGTIYGFGLPTSSSTPPADPNCPTGWTCQDIGNPKPSGSETVSNGTWNVTSGGAGFGGTSDSFRYMSQTVNGDSQVAAELINLQSLGSGTQAGVMIRQTNDPASAFYAVYDTSTGITVAYRNTYGGNTTVIMGAKANLPIYLEIQRTGDQMQAASSTDGTHYTLVPGTSATVIVPYSAMAGLATSSGISGTSGMATFAGVSTGAQNNTLQDTAPANACPMGWTCNDVGNPATVGNQSLSGTTWTVSGAGSGITNDNQTDQFHYVYQAIAGDATASTQITGVTNMAKGSYAGIMMRASTAPGSAYYGVFETAGGQLVVQARTENGLPVFQALAMAGSTLPQYLEIIRSGTTFTTYTSTDGSNWQPVVGSTDTVASLSGSLLAGLAVTSANIAQASTLTANGFAIAANAATTPPTQCPVNWTCQDVGPSIPAGSQYYYNGTWSLLAGGKDIWGAYDEMHYVAENMTGDGSVSAKVAAQGDTDPWAKAGLMIRDSTNDGGAYFAIFTTPETNGTVIQYRPTDGAATTQITGVTTSAPIYLKITRSGSTFTAYTSADGSAWTAFPNGSVSIPAMPASAYVGMASTSHSQFGTNTTTYTNFELTPSNTSLPGAWVNNDIDNAAPTGSASYSNGVYTVNGGGNDIWGTSYGNLDQSHYVSQALDGDGSIVARVTSQTNTSDWAKAGIMIKQSPSADAPYALLAVTPSNGIAFQSQFTNSTSGGTFALPVWLKLTRTGNTINAYTSPNGTTWTQVGTTSVAMNSAATAGLFVTSHNAGALSTAAFDNVTVTSTGTNSGLPSPWADTDMGGATPAGSASYANNVFTVNGGGNDIWGTPGGNLDQFHYVYQSITGNATITARVTSQTNTSAWAKAGVMIKQSTIAGTNYALLGTTPGNGTTFQYDFSGSVSGGNYTFPNAWVRLQRVGNTLTAFTSADNTTWTQIGQTTITLNDPITVGLFVTSHNAGALSTATFDNVSVTSP